jgi:hypothetical protein
MGAGVLVFIINAWRSRRRGPVAGDNPWRAGTLEWATSSPPPAYNYMYPPTVQGREPLWENAPDAPVVAGLSTAKRQVLVTTTLDAAPHHRYDLAGESLWPFLLAVAVAATLMLGGIFDPWYVPWCAAAMMLMLFGWFWSGPALRDRPGVDAPVPPPGGRPRGFWLGRRGHEGVKSETEVKDEDSESGTFADRLKHDPAGDKILPTDGGGAHRKGKRKRRRRH